MTYDSPEVHGQILDVPFKEKDEAKSLGAWWDPEMRKWFVPKGRDPMPFRRWFPKKGELRDGAEVRE